MNKNHDYKIDQILLAFDSSGCNHLTIEYIIDIASHLKSTIQAIYIEDNNLLNAADLPFTREVSLHTAQTRKLDTQQLSRYFRTLANQIRNMLETQAKLANIQSSFRVIRGPKIQTILQESLNAQLVLLPAVTRIPRSHKQKAIAIAIENSDGIVPLRLSAVLARKLGLKLLVICEKSVQLTDDLRNALIRDFSDIQLHQIRADDISTMVKQLKQYSVEILVIPETHSLLTQPEKIQWIINNLKCDLMVTRSSQSKKV